MNVPHYFAGIQMESLQERSTFTPAEKLPLRIPTLLPKTCRSYSRQLVRAGR